MQTQIIFPDHFQWGTSTAAAQIETASDHNWRGVKANDGAEFIETSEHEKRRMEDAEYIQQFGSIYRCGVDWARLQPEPNAPFVPEVVQEYVEFFEVLKEAGVSLMFVLHHFTHPRWFEEMGGWTKEENIKFFLEYTRQCLQHFGPYTVNWNTFNEPNVFAMNAYILGNFPPFQKNFFRANRVLRNMGKAHDVAYRMIRESYPAHPIGISLNTGTFKGTNLIGRLPAAFVRWWFHQWAARPFEQVDYWGLSYYAYILFDPLPITEIDRPGKLKQLGIPHDNMWGYYPAGFGKVMQRFWKRYKKPIWITENGICTDDAETRIKSIQDYLAVCKKVIDKGVDLRGYIHWSTIDNFEWNLGPSYRFGLVKVDPKTKNRQMTRAAEYYAKVVKRNGV